MLYRKTVRPFSWIILNMTLLASLTFYFAARIYSNPVWLKNIPVFSLLIFSAYNTWLLLDRLAARLHVNTIIREVLSFISILAGTWVGTRLINFFGIALFGAGDVKDTLLIAAILNTIRSVIHLNNLNVAARIQQKETENSKLREANTKAQLDVLHSKINPHFLYNSLNSIAGLAVVNGEKTKAMAIALSKLLRYSLNYSDAAFSTLREELDMTQTYLEIEKVRFGENLRYELTIADEAQLMAVPRFLLQPLVENCIKHAFVVSGKSNLINIHAAIEHETLVIAIADNGRPFPENIVPGFGLKQVNDKLQLLLPERSELQIANTPQKQVKIIIREPK